MCTHSTQGRRIIYCVSPHVKTLYGSGCVAHILSTIPIPANNISTYSTVCGCNHLCSRPCVQYLIRMSTSVRPIKKNMASPLGGSSPKIKRAFLAGRTPTYASKISTIGFTSPGFIKRYAALLVLVLCPMLHVSTIAFIQTAIS